MHQIKNYLSVLLISFLPLSALALETDQFHAATTILQDASPALNNYVTTKIQKALDRANQKRKSLTCEKLSDEVMTEIVGRYEISAISTFAKTSPDIVRYPDDTVGMQEYVNQSIYRDAGFPFLLFGVLSKTINVGGVYIGTDKLGHFALIGRNYFRRYLKLKSEGLSETEAIKQSVMKGIKQEVHLLGYTLGGVLSFGDLEANYQGMMFARSLCAGENPYLIREKNEWKKNPLRSFDIRNYINPKMDESFQFAFWKERIWKDIKPALAEVYCDLRSSQAYQARIKSYTARVERNQNDAFVEEFFKNKKEFDRASRDLNKLCQ